MQVYERVFELLQEKGMSQKELSEKTGIPQSTISDWKNKKVNPSSDKLMIICQVLGVTPYDILSGTESDKYEQPDFLVVNKSTDEYILIESIRKLPKSKYNRLLGYMEALADDKE